MSVFTNEFESNPILMEIEFEFFQHKELFILDLAGDNQI